MKDLRGPTPDVKCPIEFKNKLLKQTLSGKPNNTHQTHTDTTLSTFTELFAKLNYLQHTHTYEFNAKTSPLAMYSPYHQHVQALDHHT